MKKLLESAIANAKNNYESAKTDGLYIKRVVVDEAPKLKRWRARARGRAMPIQKKTSHITLVLEAPSKLKDENEKRKTINKK